jgi:hypothetical protein
MQTRGFPEWTDTVLAHEQAERGHCGTRTRRRIAALVGEYDLREDVPRRWVERERVGEAAERFGFGSAESAGFLSGRILFLLTSKPSEVIAELAHGGECIDALQTGVKEIVCRDRNCAAHRLQRIDAFASVCEFRNDLARSPSSS